MCPYMKPINCFLAGNLLIDDPNKIEQISTFKVQYRNEHNRQSVLNQVNVEKFKESQL